MGEREKVGGAQVYRLGPGVKTADFFAGLALHREAAGQ